MIKEELLHAIPSHQAPQKQGKEEERSPIHYPLFTVQKHAKLLRQRACLFPISLSLSHTHTVKLQ